MTSPTVISIKPATTTLFELRAIRGLIDSLIAEGQAEHVDHNLCAARLAMKCAILVQERLAK